MSWKFKKFILQVVSCFLRVWDDKFTICEVAFYKLNIYDHNFVNYHHSWVKFQGNKSLQTVWKDDLTEMQFDSR